MAGIRTFRLHELGCKVNQYEAQLLREGFLAIGLAEAPEEHGADLVVVNSCSVTESGAAKSRHAVRQLGRRNPGARILVTGCYVESDREDCEALDGVVRAFGNAEKAGIVPYVARQLLGMDGELPELPRGIRSFAGHTRAFVKVQDGCRDHCAYCIIPSLRGEPRSRPMDEIAEELAALARNGYREVVFTGVHLGYFGFERGEKGALVALLRLARATPGLERAKLSSVEVHEIDSELVDLFAADPFFVPHFHLPLQAGSDRTLRSMRRKYGTGRFRGAVDLLRDRLVEPALTTDLIVGFPGESSDDFDDSLRFCEEMDFAKMHVFPFSPRSGTEASHLPGLPPAKEILRRRQAAAELDDRMSTAYRRRFIGRRIEVLVEGRRMGGRLTGLSDRFQRVVLDDGDDLHNRLVEVEVLGEKDGLLEGRIPGRQAASAPSATMAP